MKDENRFYTYIYLDPRKPSEWEFEGIKFEFQPFYVGKGEGKRINAHVTDLEKSRFNIRANIINKIKKETGEDPIKRKVIENLTETQAFEIEIAMIKHFGRIDLGTGILANLTDGGPGSSNAISSPESRLKRSKAKIGKVTKNSKRVNQFDLDLNFLKQYDSVAALTLELNLTQSERWSVYGNCRNTIKTAIGYIWQYDKTSAYKPPEKEKTSNLIKVSKFDQEGNFIETFSSVNDAACSINAPATSISRCCRGNRSLCRDFQWRYGESQENIGPPKKKEFVKRCTSRAIFQYELFGRFIRSFESIAQASRITNIKSSSISAATTGRNLSGGGFQWFVEDKGEFCPKYLEHKKLNF